MASIISYTKTKIDQLLALKANVADAVALSTAVGAAPVAGGYAGTANTAARGDHAHRHVPAKIYPLVGTSGWVHPMGAENGLAQCGNNKCPCVPFPVPRRMTLNTLSNRLYTLADAGNGKMAIYATAANGLPTGAPVWTSAALSSTAAGNVIVESIALTLDPGLYFIAYGSYGFTSTRGVPRAGHTWGNYDPYLIGMQPSPGGSTTTPGIFLSGFNETTGAFPTLTANTSEYVVDPGSSAMWYAIQATAA